MSNEVGIIAYRAYTNNEEDAAGGLSNYGRWYVLDELVPGWRECPNGYLLWTLTESEELAGASAVKFLRLNKDVRVIVALGRKAARALGVPNDMDWFTGYGLSIGKRRVVVIPVPSPSPVNRTTNDKNVRKKIRKLFDKLLNDPSFVESLTGADA